MAVLLSVIPGLGHIYKGHKLVGVLFILGAPLAVALSALAATATAGFGLGLMVFYWFAVDVPCVRDFRSRDAGDQGRRRAILITLLVEASVQSRPGELRRVDFFENLAQAVTELPSG